MALGTVVMTAGITARDEVRQQLNNLILLTVNGLVETATVAIGTTASKVKTTATALYKIDGVPYSLAATDDFWTLSGTTVAISSWQKYLLLVDSAGAASVAQGVQSTVSAAAVVLPPPPQGKAILGVLTVATSGAGTFIPGTTLLSAAQVTDTYADGFDSSVLKLVVLA